MNRAPAPAKLNLALVVGPRSPDGKHELTTIYQRIDLCDRVALEPSPRLVVDGFRNDTLVRDALALLAERAEVEPRWRARIWKKVPDAAGLGGGSSDAATVLRLANDTLAEPLSLAQLRRVAARLGADVPFFLAPGPQLGTGDGTTLAPLDLPQDYWVVVVLPKGSGKASTAAVYAAFDARAGTRGYRDRRADLLRGLERVERPRDLRDLPRNDLASSRLAEDLEARGAFRADVSGAGPAVYGLFHRREDAAAAATNLRARGRTWLTVPTWYG